MNSTSLSISLSLFVEVFFPVLIWRKGGGGGGGGGVKFSLFFPFVDVSFTFVNSSLSVLSVVLSAWELNWLLQLCSCWLCPCWFG